MKNKSLEIYSDPNYRVEITAKAIHKTHNYGRFIIYVVKQILNNRELEHIVLVKNKVSNCEDVLCRISSECIPGTVFNSSDCDCAEQNEISLEFIKKEKKGIVIYLRQEGRGHGLTTKILALANKNKGMDTFKAVEVMGLKADVRDYSISSIILNYLKVSSINIITNNPDKINALRSQGVSITKQTLVNALNINSIKKHLLAKVKAGHQIKNL